MITNNKYKIEMRCGYCNHVFEAVRADAKFCSNVCRAQHSRTGGPPARPRPVVADSEAPKPADQEPIRVVDSETPTDWDDERFGKELLALMNRWSGTWCMDYHKMTEVIETLDWYKWQVEEKATKFKPHAEITGAPGEYYVFCRLPTEVPDEYYNTNSPIQVVESDDLDDENLRGDCIGPFRLKKEAQSVLQKVQQLNGIS